MKNQIPSSHSEAKSNKEDTERRMCQSNGLNTKSITKCTLRIYEQDFAKKLDDLYSKVGRAQSFFLVYLIKETTMQLESRRK